MRKEWGVTDRPTPPLAPEIDIDPRFEALVQFLEKNIPFNCVLGIRAVKLHEGKATLVIPWKDELIGDAARPAVHGGVISALIDTAGGAACFSMLSNPRDRVSTVDLRVDYLRPGPAEDLYCSAEVIRMGNKVAVTRMEVRSALSAQTPDSPPIAAGTAVYNIVRRED